jgi:hypothetical protein
VSLALYFRLIASVAVAAELPRDGMPCSFLVRCKCGEVQIVDLDRIASLAFSEDSPGRPQTIAQTHAAESRTFRAQMLLTQCSPIEIARRSPRSPCYLIMLVDVSALRASTPAAQKQLRISDINKWRGLDVDDVPSWGWFRPLSMRRPAAEFCYPQGGIRMGEISTDTPAVVAFLGEEPDVGSPPDSPYIMFCNVIERTSVGDNIKLIKALEAKQAGVECTPMFLNTWPEGWLPKTMPMSGRPLAPVHQRYSDSGVVVIYGRKRST